MNVATQHLDTILDEIIAHITPPEGWEVVDLNRKDEEEPETDIVTRFRKNINANLAFAAAEVEKLIEAIYKRCGIKVKETYISIDGDSAFHIFLLFNNEDFFLPEMQAVRILAEEYLVSSDVVGIRFTFTLAEEFNRYHNDMYSHKLKHVSHFD